MIKVNLIKSIKLLVPLALRKTRLQAWVTVFLSYLHMISLLLYEFRESLRKEILITPQIIYLEYYLNDRFGRTDIFISEGYLLGPWVWSSKPAAPDFDFFLDTPTSFVYASGDSNSVGFVVNIPSSIIDSANTIAAMVQRHKLVGKSFIIQIFSV